tara:strand:- start:195 stop:455 length:261 start_codon:yes stop_codon:yes gene_type:complete
MSAKKLTKKELETLQGALSEMRTAESNFVAASKNRQRVEEAVAQSWTALQGFEGELTSLQAAMMEKYGDVNINVQTGEFVEPSEEN